MIQSRQPLQNYRIFLIVTVFLFLGFFLYSNTFDSPFLFDDTVFIVENTHVHMQELTAKRIAQSLSGPLWNRPLTMFSFALNYYFGRFDVWGYHMVNTLIHILTGILLFFLLNITLIIDNNRSSNKSYKISNPTGIALFAALLWFVSPICTQAVTYIFQRGHSMAAMFYLLSICLYVKGRLSKGSNNHHFFWFLGSIISGFFAMSSKAIAASLPFYIFLYEWYFFADLNKAWVKRNIWWGISACIPFIFFAIVHTFAGNKSEVFLDYSSFSHTLGQSLLTQFRVVMHYLGLIVYPNPTRLTFDYDFSISNSLIDPLTTLFAIVIILALIGMAFRIAKKQVLFSFCIFWFFGHLLIEAIFSKDLVWDYRTYIPAMFIYLLMVIFIFSMIKSFKTVSAILGIIILIFSGWTYQRNAVYHDAITLWSDTVKKSKNKVRPLVNLGNAYFRLGQFNKGISYMKEAIRIKPENAIAHHSWGKAMLKQGQIKEAIVHFSDALRIKPDYADVHYSLGSALQRQGRLQEAMEHYMKAIWERQ